jgi:hypothetical protein
MKIFSAFTVISLFFVSIAFSQSSDLSVHGGLDKLYLFHTVVAKENWYSVGRIYNVSPKEMAPFNGLTIENPLSIGQELKIPLTNINFSQDGKKKADETFVAVYHIVQPNEMLSHVSAAYNRVPVENLEKWNKIKKEGAKEGLQLIVGYLKVKSSLSYLAGRGTMNYEAAAAPSNNIVEKPVEKPAEKPFTIQEIKKAEVVGEKSQPSSKQTKAADSKSSASNDNKPAFTSLNNTTRPNRGYFANDYNEGSNKIAGLAGTFKSTSGWNDGKYYVLVNNIPVGTIVKVVAPATQKSVYAKVLGQLPDMKESEGLTIRISNAAASELGEGEGKFNVQILY